MLCYLRSVIYWNRSHRLWIRMPLSDLDTWPTWLPLFLLKVQFNSCKLMSVNCSVCLKDSLRSSSCVMSRRKLAASDLSSKISLELWIDYCLLGNFLLIERTGANKLAVLNTDLESFWAFRVGATFTSFISAISILSRFLFLIGVFTLLSWLIFWEMISLE